MLVNLNLPLLFHRAIVLHVQQDFASHRAT